MIRIWLLGLQLSLLLTIAGTVHLNQENLNKIRRFIDNGQLIRLKRQAINNPQPWPGPPGSPKVLNVPIPTNIGFFPGGGGGISDNCPRHQIQMEDGSCQSPLTRGKCGVQEEVILDPQTNKGFCAPRLCPVDRIFLPSTQLCHDPGQIDACPPGRELYYTAYGTPVCTCPDGTVEGDDDLDDDVCEVILSTSLQCMPGQVFWFKDFYSPPQCLPDPCGGTNLNRNPNELPFVPSEKDGKCYQIGKSDGVCPSNQYYSVNYETLKGRCVTLEEAGYNIFDDQTLKTINDIYGSPIDPANSAPISNAGGSGIFRGQQVTQNIGQHGNQAGQFNNNNGNFIGNNLISSDLFNNNIINGNQNNNQFPGNGVNHNNFAKNQNSLQGQTSTNNNQQSHQFSINNRKQNLNRNQLNTNNQQSNQFISNNQGNQQKDFNSNQFNANDQQSSVSNSKIVFGQQNNYNNQNGQQQSSHSSLQSNSNQQNLADNNKNINPTNQNSPNQQNFQQIFGSQQSTNQNNFNQHQYQNNFNQPHFQNNINKPQLHNNFNQPQHQNNFNQPQPQNNLNQPQPQNNFNQPQPQNNFNQPQAQNKFNQQQQNINFQQTSNIQQTYSGNNQYVNHHQTTSSISSIQQSFEVFGGGNISPQTQQYRGSQQGIINHQQPDSLEVFGQGILSSQNHGSNQGIGNYQQPISIEIFGNRNLSPQNQQTHVSQQGIGNHQQPISIEFFGQGNMSPQHQGIVNHQQPISVEVCSPGPCFNSPEIFGANQQQSIELFSQNVGAKIGKSLGVQEPPVEARLASSWHIHPNGQLQYHSRRFKRSATNFESIIQKSVDKRILLSRKKRRSLPYASPSNVFETRLLSCRPGSVRDINSKCRNTILPARIPKRRGTRGAPPIPPTPSCPRGMAFNIRRRCVASNTAQNSIVAFNLG